MRQRLKESLRKRMKKESGSVLSQSQEKKKKLPYDNYGSFFGPSQPVIAQRVIQESKSILETQHLQSRASNSYHSNKKSPASTAARTKPGVLDQPPRANNELKMKVQKLKDTRDYSFLFSDDTELPAPTKVPPPRNDSVRNSDGRSAQVLPKSKQPTSKPSSQVFNGREERKPVSINRPLQPKAGLNKLAGSSRPNLTSVDPRKQLGSNAGNGPGRPVGSKGLPSKLPAATMYKKASAVVAKNPVPVGHKTPSSKLHSSVPKQNLQQKKEFRNPNTAKVMPKQLVSSSKPQIKPPKHIPSRATMQEQHPKKKPVRQYSDEDDDDEDVKAISMIRSMFRYNPKKFAGADDDDSDMEANYDDILKEERRRLLGIFCVINMLNYVDRGAIASNGVNGSLRTCTDSGICTAGSGIQGDFNLDYFEDGLLSSAFMVGLLVASPIFASLSKSHNPFRLIGVGLSVWTFATAACGFSFDFWSIMICRMLVGFGEASFISLAAPFIDDNAPVAQCWAWKHAVPCDWNPLRSVEQADNRQKMLGKAAGLKSVRKHAEILAKTAWLSVFYMCIPTGIALGYIYGGLVGDYFSWRYAFWVEAILMLPFAVLGFVMKPLQLKGFVPVESKKALTSIETVAPEVEEEIPNFSKDRVGVELRCEVDSGSVFLETQPNGPLCSGRGLLCSVMRGPVGSSNEEGVGVGVGPVVLAGEAQEVQVGRSFELVDVREGQKPMEFPELGEEAQISKVLRLERRGEGSRPSTGESDQFRRPVSSLEKGTGFVTPNLGVCKARKGGWSSEEKSQEKEVGIGSDQGFENLVPNNQLLGGRIWEGGSEDSELEHYTLLVFSELVMDLSMSGLEVENQPPGEAGPGEKGFALGTLSAQFFAKQNQVEKVDATRGVSHQSLEASNYGGATILLSRKDSIGSRGERQDLPSADFLGTRDQGNTTVLDSNKEPDGAEQEQRVECHNLGSHKTLLPLMSKGEVSKWVVHQMETVGKTLGVLSEGHEVEVRSLFRRIEGGEEGGRSCPKDLQKILIADTEISNDKGSMLAGNEELCDHTSKNPSMSIRAFDVSNQFSRFLKEMKVLLLDKVYVINVLGYIAYNFVIGAYSYWGPKAGYDIYHMSNADLMFGGITIVCGIFGTLAGGYVLDCMSSTISNAFKEDVYEKTYLTFDVSSLETP
ncbi:hypothetical protein HHK36_003188 [Tetracentron sinense]|uniref:Uncharacterized protein n=1 Tax=Tetracentron sinense TaxID=13715 RepID=A0A835DP37_TETSI|nr:hypothetical protein HHK36_003188 [Tetracentron sinense]